MHYRAPVSGNNQYNAQCIEGGWNQSCFAGAERSYIVPNEPAQVKPLAAWIRMGSRVRPRQTRQINVQHIPPNSQARTSRRNASAAAAPLRLSKSIIALPICGRQWVRLEPPKPAELNIAGALTDSKRDRSILSDRVDVGGPRNADGAGPFHSRFRSEYEREYEYGRG
jgi:hypothetical protein